MAEAAAAEYLKSLGYQIIEQNWRTKYCEIDIVAKQRQTVYFVEVKYRQTDTHGHGFDYITDKKMEQMRFAAELWVSENEWNGDYALAAIEASGGDYVINQFLSDL